MISKKAPIDYIFIDSNIRSLVSTLNMLDGIRTMGSCGGHENPNRIQHKKGTWFVSFWVYKSGRKTSLPLLKDFCKENSVKLSKHDNWYALVGIGCPRKITPKLLKFLKIRNQA